MNSIDTSTFNHLRAAVITSFLKTNVAPKDVKNWSGEDIVLFQEDLFNKVKARVSEKWFYTYFKNDSEKLPRIDMLNLLSAYVGYKNWSDFKASIVENKSSKSKILYVLPLLIIIAVLIFWYSNRQHTYNLCFVNDIDGTPITNITLDIKILNMIDTPIYLKSDDRGCFSYKTKDDHIKFIVQSPYYKTDTISKSIDQMDYDVVKVSTDDYALMLDYYSNKKLINWKAHKKNLESIFSNDALIYQIYPNNMGIDLYTKDEFIDKLTIPARSLKKMKIISKTYSEGKIVKLKFIIE